MSEVDRVRAAYERRDDLDRYDLAAPDIQAIDALRRRSWSRAIRRHDVQTVLEVGSGVGFALGWMSNLGVRLLVGADLIHERLVSAATLSPGVRRVEADGRHLPVRDASLDAVVCSTLFSSILSEAVAREVAADVSRVLRPGGIVLWFDMRWSNPQNPDVRKVARRDLERWFPGFELDVASAVLAPPVARRLHRWPRAISVVESFPPLRSHLVGELTKPS